MSVIWSEPTSTSGTRRSRDRGAPPTCRIAILGFGTVGRSLATLIARSPAGGVSLTRIANRAIERKRVDWLPSTVTWSESLHETVTAPDVDVVVELLGGIEPAFTCIRNAIGAGKSVVTANKQVMARHGGDLFALAARHRVELRCEAAAGGVVPIVRAMSESLCADRLTRFAAVLNGTSNFVLERRERGVSLRDAVDEAQRAGIAEANPDADLDGRDAAAKIALLSLFAFGTLIDAESVSRTSVASIDRADFALAQRFGVVLKPVAYARRSPEAVEAWTGPALVPPTSPLASVRGARNAIIVTGEHSGDTVLAGEGAGGAPTAVAVLSDVLSVSRCGRWRAPTLTRTPVTCNEPVVPHVVRLTVFSRDQGLPAVIAGLHLHDVRVMEVVTLSGDVRAAHVALRLDACRARDVHRALSVLQREGALRGTATVMPLLTGDADVGGA